MMTKKTPKRGKKVDTLGQALTYHLEYILPCDNPSEEREKRRKRKLDELDSLRDQESDGKHLKKCKTLETVDLDCEWKDCQFNTHLYVVFMNHVREHVDEVAIKVCSPPHQDMFACLWDDCGFECPNSKEMVRHINYHSVHTKLKSLGFNMIKTQGLKGCILDSNQRNILPDLTESLKCKWSYCPQFEEEFQPQEFFWHVEGHKDVDRLDCLWDNCTKRDFASKTRLREHLRSHSQEKMIGCPVCGSLFASRVKLFDHLKRQQEASPSVMLYTCTALHCNKSFALERLLRDHMRSHINHYACSICDMCWPNPSSLNTHIKYRHTQTRDFPCDECDFRAKSHADLKSHARSHLGEVLTCMEGCGFVCKSNNVMKNHFMKVHMKEGPGYSCHLCEKVYRRGTSLTCHLKKKHKVTSTTSRFRYSRDRDTGFYTAQLIRLEVQDGYVVEDKDGAHSDPDADLSEIREDESTVESTSSVRSITSSTRLSSTTQSSPRVRPNGSDFGSPVVATDTGSSTPYYLNTGSSTPNGDAYCVEAALTSRPYSGSSTPDISTMTGTADAGGVETEMAAVGHSSQSRFRAVHSSRRRQSVVTSSPVHHYRESDLVSMTYSGDIENVEIDITGDQFGAEFTNEESNGGGLEENRGIQIAEQSQTDSRTQKLAELKRIGAQVSDISHFLSTIGNEFSD